MTILLTGILIGFLVGAGGAAVVARWFAVRSIARVREAEQRARGAERLAELGAMTGGLAHEIKNPLSTIGLNAQLLAEGIADLAVDDAERSRLRRRVDALRREADRLRDILQDFLEYAGELHIEPRPADLNAVVEELVDFFLPQAERQGVRVRTHLAPDARAEVDVPHVKQAVLNLMLNAVQAMVAAAPKPSDGEPIGELILRTELRAERDRPGCVVLHVTDTGPGIPEDKRDSIFHPYFTTKAGGTGLGLPTTRRIVEAHGGRLELHSDLGRGTDFALIFPRREASAA